MTRCIAAYGVAVSYDSDRPSCQSGMSSPNVMRASRTSLDLPNPASAISETTRPVPVAATCETAFTIVASSSSRPTSGDARPAMPRMFSGRGRAFTTRKAGTGSTTPFTWTPPMSSNSNSCSTRRFVSAVIWTVPAAAVDSIRAARLIASPIAVYSTRRSEPTAPTTTRPVLMPTRTSRSMFHSRRMRSLYGRIASMISSPASTARSGSSSWPMGAPKKARIASPMSRASVPSYRYTGAMRCSKAPFMMSAHSSGSSVWAAAVEPCTSQKSMVTTRRSPTIPPLSAANSSLFSNSGGIKRRKPASSALPCRVGPVAAGSGAAAAGAGAPTLAPHEKQNAAPAGSSVPHASQAVASAEPQPIQNFAPDGFSVEQVEQVMRLSPHPLSNQRPEGSE